VRGRGLPSPGVRRWGIVAGSLALLVAVVYPAVHPTELDSLPFSNYPMFAHRRGTVTRFDLAVRVDPSGVEHPLDPRRIGGTDQPVQAAETVLQAIRTEATEVLCEEIAATVDDGNDGRIEVISVRYDAVRWFRGDHDPVERTLHASCPIGGGA
jgi:hypothetical protein